MEDRIMARQRLPIAPHLAPEEIARRYRACRSGVEKTHWQVIWLLTRSPEPPTPAEVAARVGLTPAWARTVLKRWNAEGPAGLADRRAAANGGRPRLSDEQQAALFEALQGRPDDGGLWTGPKVAAYVLDRWGVVVRKETGWRRLRRLGLTPQVPRPVNPKAATADEQRRWKRRPGREVGRAPTRPPRQGRRAVGRG
jgi:transposase